MGRSMPVWVVSVLVVVSAGIALGAVLGGGRTGGESGAAPLKAVPVAPPSNPVSAARASAPAGGASSDSAVSAPVVGPDLSGDAGGRSYVAVGGAGPDVPGLASAASVARPGLRDVAPDLAAAPTAAVGDVGGRPERWTGGPVISAAEGGAPYSPVRSVDVETASGMGLLAVRRGGGRVVFYESRAGVADAVGAGLEGDWAVVGDCGTRFHLDLAQPTSVAGEVRGVGRMGGRGGDWDVGLAVPAQACGATVARWLAPRSPSAVEKVIGKTLGPGDLVAVVDEGEGRRWLLFRGADGSGRMVIVRGRTVLWSHDVGGPDDGAARFLGVYRRGRNAEGWCVFSDGDEPTGFWRGGVDSVEGPVPFGG